MILRRRARRLEVRKGSPEEVRKEPSLGSEGWREGRRYGQMQKK